MSALPVTEISLPADVEPEVAALLYWRDMAWLMSQEPEPVSDTKGE